MINHMLEVRGIQLGQMPQPVLAGVDLRVDDGDLLVVVGKNGAGKSSLVNVISGVLSPDGGQIRRGPVAVVPQDAASAALGATVYEQVGFGSAARGLDRLTIGHRVQDALRQVGIDLLIDRDPSSLSGGEKALVNVASALADLGGSVGTIIFDEVTAHLDPLHAQRVRQIAVVCAEAGSSVLWITQDEHEFKLGNRLALLDDGYLLDVRPQQAIDALAFPQPQRSLPVTVGQTRVTLHELVSNTGIGPVTLQAASGEVVCLVGASGAGKSTTLQMIAGVQSSQSGSLHIAQSSGAISPATALALQRSEDAMVAETVCRDLIFGLDQLGVPSDEWQTRTEESLKAVNLPPSEFADRDPLSLSGGQRRRVGIAAIAAVRPGVLLLDEPTAGLDRPSRAAIAELIISQADGGVCVIIATHDMDLIDAVGGRAVTVERFRSLETDRPRSQRVLDVRLALVGVVMLWAAIMMSSSMLGVVMTLVISLIWATSVAGARGLIGPLRPVGIVLLSLVAIQSILGAPQEVVLYPGTTTESAFLAGLIGAIRVLAIVLSTIALTRSAHPIRLAEGIGWWVRPLRSISSLPQMISLTLGLSLGMVRSLDDERVRIHAALIARGLPRRAPDIRRWYGRTRQLALPIIVIALRRSRLLAVTMVLRGWDRHLYPTVIVPWTTSVIDLVFIIGATGVFLAAIPL